jgi:hypothetical protein
MAIATSLIHKFRLTSSASAWPEIIDNMRMTKLKQIVTTSRANFPTRKVIAT